MKKEIIIYLLFGVATTIVNWVVYVFALLFFNLTISNAIAWIIAVIFAFVVNKIYVFKSKESSIKGVFKELSLFFGARVISGVFEIVSLPLLVYIGLNQKIYDIEGAVAKIIVSIVVIVSNYWFSKRVIFSQVSSLRD